MARLSAIEIDIDLQNAQQKLAAFESQLADKTASAATIAQKAIERLEKAVASGRMTAHEAQQEMARLQQRLTANAEAAKRFDAATAGQSRALAGMQNQVTQANGSLEKIEGTLHKFAIRMHTMPLAAFGTGSVMAFAQFGAEVERAETRMKVLAKASGASAGELAALQKTVDDLGASTAFSGKETTEAATSLITLGSSARETIQQLPAVLSLASIAQKMPEQVAEAVKGTLNAFQYGADQSTRIADLYATAFINSAADIPRLAEGLKEVAPIMAQVKISAEDTAAALNLINDNGILGSSAGTQLKSALLQLAQTNAQVDKALKDGLNLSRKSFQDDLGNFKGLESFKILHDAMAKIPGNFDRLGKLGDIFGKENATAVGILINSYDTLGKSLTDYQKQMKYLVSSQKLATEMTADSKGAIDNLGGAWQLAGKNFFASLSPALQKGAEQFTEWGASLAAFFKENQQSFYLIGEALVGVVSLVASTVDALIQAVRGAFDIAVGSFLQLVSVGASAISKVAGWVGASGLASGAKETAQVFDEATKRFSEGAGDAAKRMENAAKKAKEVFSKFGNKSDVFLEPSPLEKVITKSVSVAPPPHLFAGGGGLPAKDDLAGALALQRQIYEVQNQALEKEAAIRSQNLVKSQEEYALARQKIEAEKAIDFLRAKAEEKPESRQAKLLEADLKARLGLRQAEIKLQSDSAQEAEQAQERIFKQQQKAVDKESELAKKHVEIQASLKGQKPSAEEIFKIESQRLRVWSLLEIQAKKTQAEKEEAAEQFTSQYQLLVMNRNEATAKEAQEAVRTQAEIEIERSQRALEFNQRNAELDALLTGQVVSTQKLLDFEKDRLQLALKRAMLEAKTPAERQTAMDTYQNAMTLARKEQQTKGLLPPQEFSWKDLGTQLAGQAVQALGQPIIQRQGASAAGGQMAGATIGMALGNTVLAPYGGQIWAPMVGSLLGGALFPGGGDGSQKNKLDDGEFTQQFGIHWTTLQKGLLNVVDQSAAAARQQFAGKFASANAIQHAGQRKDATLATFSGQSQALAEAGQILAAKTSLEEMRVTSGVAELAARQAQIMAEIADAQKTFTSTQIVGMEGDYPIYATVNQQQEIDVTELEAQLADVTQQISILNPQLSQTAEFIEKTSLRLQHDLNAQLDQMLAGETGGLATQIKKLQTDVRGDEWTVGLLTKIKQLGLSAGQETALIEKANSALSVSIQETLDAVSQPWADFLAQDSIGEVGYALHQLDETASKAIESLTKAAQETGVDVSGAVDQINQSLARQKQIKKEAAAKDISGILSPFASSIHESQGADHAWRVSQIEDAGREALKKAEELAAITGGSVDFARAVITQGVAAQKAEVLQERTDTLKGFQDAVSRIDMSPLQRQLAEFDDQAAEFARTLAGDSEMLAAAQASISAQRQKAIEEAQQSQEKSLDAVRQANFEAINGKLAGTLRGITQKFDEMRQQYEYSASQLAEMARAQALEVRDAVKQYFQPFQEGFANVGKSIQAVLDGINGKKPTLAEATALVNELSALGSLEGVTDAERIKAYNDKLNEAFAKAQDVQRLQTESLSTQKSSLQGLLGTARSLRDAVNNIKFGKLSTGDAQTTLSQASAEFQRLQTAALSAAGTLATSDDAVIGQLQGFAQTYLEKAQEVYKSSADYTRIFGQVTSALDAVTSRAEATLNTGAGTSGRGLDDLGTLIEAINTATVDPALKTLFETLKGKAEGAGTQIDATVHRLTVGLDVGLTGDRLTSANGVYTWADSVKAALELLGNFTSNGVWDDKTKKFVITGNGTLAGNFGDISTTPGTFTTITTGYGTLGGVFGKAGDSQISTTPGTFTTITTGYGTLGGVFGKAGDSQISTTPGTFTTITTGYATLGYNFGDITTNAKSPTMLATGYATLGYNFGSITTKAGDDATMLATGYATLGYNFGSISTTGGTYTTIATGYGTLAGSITFSGTANGTSITFTGSDGSVSGTVGTKIDVAANIGTTPFTNLEKIILYGATMVSATSANGFRLLYEKGNSSAWETFRSSTLVTIRDNTNSQAVSNISQAGLTLPSVTAAGGAWDLPALGFGLDGRGGIPLIAHPHEMVLPQEEANFVRQAFERPRLSGFDSSALAQTSDPEIKRLLKEILEEIRQARQEGREINVDVDIWADTGEPVRQLRREIVATNERGKSMKR